MPLKPETQSAFDDWLNGLQGHLSAEDYQSMRAIYSKSEPAQQYAATSTMMRADYSRQTQAQNKEFETKLAQLNAESARLAALDQQMAEWEQYVKTNTVSAADYQAAVNEMNQLKQYREHTEQKIRGLGLDELINGLEEDGGQPVNNNQNNNNNGQPGQTPKPPDWQFNPNTLPGNRYATRQAVENQIQEVGVSAIVAQAQLMRLDQEHRELTGKGLPNPDALLVEALHAGKPLLDYIQDKLEFPKMRADAAQKAQEAEIERRVQERVSKELSQSRIPVPGGQAQSPVLAQTIQGLNAASAEDRSNIPLFGKPGQQGRAAQKATEAFLQGKYRGQTVNPWTS